MRQKVWYMFKKFENFHLWVSSLTLWRQSRILPVFLLVALPPHLISIIICPKPLVAFSLSQVRGDKTFQVQLGAVFRICIYFLETFQRQFQVQRQATHIECAGHLTQILSCL